MVDPRSRPFSNPLAPRAPARHDEPPSPEQLDRRGFDAALQALLDAHQESHENPGSVRCERCRACVSCMFCKDCEACHRCTHCTGCRNSSHLTHCTDCAGCHDCAYCEQSENCAGASYLVLCRDCSDCTYCFGCVGLAKKDFHILNRPYTRSEYFRIMEKLRGVLGMATRRR